MKRKVIKLGQATYVASLPNKWIREHNLEKGDYLEVEIKDANLIIGTKKIPPQMKVEIDLANYNERTIRNILNQSYRKGFDIIKLKYNSDDQLEDIREITNSTLFGFDVVRENKNYCIVENIAEPAADKYEVILRKLFLTVKQEAEEITEDLQRGKFNTRKRKNNKNLIDNYTNFIRRLIIKHKIKGSKNSYLLFYSVSLMSLIHHAYYYMHSFASKNNLKIQKQIVDLVKEVNEMYNVYYEAFYKNDMSLADKVQRSKKKLLNDKCFSIMQKVKGPESIILYHIAELIRMIQMSSTAFFGFVEPIKED